MMDLPKFIKLPNQEIIAKSGIFKNSVTGAVWQLSNKDGKLMVDVPNYSFQISPLSLNKFRPVNTLVNLDIEFEQPDENKPLLMHLYAKGIKRATFEALKDTDLLSFPIA